MYLKQQCVSKFSTTIFEMKVGHGYVCDILKVNKKGVRTIDGHITSSCECYIPH